MTDYWATIQERLHEESGLHHPNNTMGRILESYFNGLLNEFSKDNEDFVDQGFLITSDGLYLDIRGDEFALPRKEGEYATGVISFTLTKEVNANETPKKIENISQEGVTFNYVPESIQNMIDSLNKEREENGEKLLETRECTKTFTIPEGTVVVSDTGFEYILRESVEFPQGETIISGKIIAKESGVRYNTEEETINVVNSSQINSDLRCTNPTKIFDGKDGESDDDYRRRLLNNINTNISVNFLKRQNIIIYTKNKLNDSVRTSMTSFNPCVNNMYCAIPPTDEVSDFLNNELIANDNVVVYIKGW